MAVTTRTERARAFDTEGYVSPIRIHDTAEAAQIRSQFDTFEGTEGREKSQIGLLDRHDDQRFVWELATDPKILDCVQEILGRDVMVLATHFFCKYPEPSMQQEPGAKFVAWHQDVTYWGLEPPMAMTAWYAVDDSDVENGCMRIIPGTHRGGIREHGKSARAGNLLSINQEVPVDPDEADRAVDLELQAGEISLHHGMLVHGSNPNLSHRRRCGLTIRYITPDVRQAVQNSLNRPWRPTLVRGEDRYHHYEDRPRPFSP